MYKRWRVYSTFFTGLLIGLCFAILLAAPMASVTTNGDILPESDWLIWRVLVLMMAGILGGTIYPIVTDGYIEMPRFVVNQGAHFKAGLFGDILLGIAGATILELLLPAEWSILSEQNAAVSSIAVAATGIIGGYGGRAMLRFALQRVVRDGQNLDQWSRQRSRQKQADTPPTSVESTLEDSEVTTASTQAEVALTENLIASLGQFVAQGGSEQQLRSLKQQIQDLSVSLKPALFDALVVQRQALELSAATSEQEPLPQPLPQPFSRLVMAFSTLADSGWQDHRCYGQMALIYDLGNPNHASVDPAKAIAYLDRAIASRGALALGQTWTYELHKAAIRILQAARVNSAQSVSAISVANRYQPEIMASLHSISQVYNLATIVASPEAQPHGTVVLAWIHQHRAMLATQANTQEWLSEADRKNNTFAETASVEESIANKRVEKRTVPQKTVANAPSATAVENTTLDLNDFVEPANPHNYRLSNCDLLLGQGFNLLTLDPFNLSGSAKSEAIFRFYDGEALEIQDEVRKLHPQGSRYRSVSKGGLSSTSHTNILYTEADAQRFFASSLGGLAAQLLGKILPCSLSGSYEKIKRERRSEKQIFSVTQANYIDYLLDLIWDRPQDLHLDHLFRRAVAQLPLRSELSDGKEILPYLDFIEKFGTHIAVQIQLGGLVHQKISLSESVYGRVVNRGASLEAEAQKMFTARVASASESSRYQEIRDHSEHLQFCGGMMNCENVFEWFGTVKDDPAPVKVSLRSLHEVLSPAFFPTDTTIVQKQALLAEVTQQYLENTSEAPAWELWRSPAVGGDGGQAFSSIDLSPVSNAAHQAQYQAAQVAAVKVWIGTSWIKRVEIVLADEAVPVDGLSDGLPNKLRTETVSLEEDPSGGEEPRILRLAPGDYITAVKVRAVQAGLLRDRATYVGFMEILTHQGQRLSVGQRDERAIALDIPAGYQVIGVHGRKGKYLDRLGVISAPLPRALAQPVTTDA